MTEQLTTSSSTSTEMTTCDAGSAKKSNGSCVATDLSPVNKYPTTTSDISTTTSVTTSTSASSSALTTLTETLPVGVNLYAYICASDQTATTYCTVDGDTPVPVTTEFAYSLPSLVTTTLVLTVGFERPMLSTTSATSTTSSSSSILSSQPTSPSPTETSTASTGTVAGVNNPSASQIKSSSSQSKSNTGAVAGAAVGCFLAGLILAGLIAFFVLRKRKNERYARPANYAPAPVHSFGEKGTPMVAISSMSPDFLPQQADDAEIRRRISTVIDQIDQHVENFYVNQPTQLTPTMEAELSRFETSQLPYALAACFERSSQPTVLIKHCLAFHTFNLTMAPGGGTTPILPSDIANMIGASYGRSISPQASREFITAFSSWKRLTSYLRPDLLRDPNALNKSTEASTRIANHFTDIFTPWRNETYSDDQRARHLTELLDHAVHTAIWLFGQPDSYRFDWTPPPANMSRSVSVTGRGAEKLVVAPGVSKVTHGGARLPGAGQQVLPAVMQRM